MADKNPYDILGLRRGASEHEVHAAFAAMLMRFRPALCPENELAHARIRRATKAYEQLNRSFNRAAGPAILPKPKPAPLTAYIIGIEGKMPRLEKMVSEYISLTRNIAYTVQEACAAYENTTKGLRGTFGRYVVTGERRRALNRLKTIAGTHAGVTMKTALADIKNDLSRLSNPAAWAQWAEVTPMAINTRLAMLKADVRYNSDLFLDARAVLSGRREKLLIDEQSTAAIQTIRSVNTRNAQGPR